MRLSISGEELIKSIRTGWLLYRQVIDAASHPQSIAARGETRQVQANAALFMHAWLQHQAHGNALIGTACNNPTPIGLDG